MKLIITAGGTAEKIDQVRKITNTGTGRLGSLTAEAFASRGGAQMEKIYYICEQGTVIPDLDCVKVIFTQGVDEVKNVLEQLLTREKIDAVIHSMAVSDYTVEHVTTAEDLAAYLAGRVFPLERGRFRSEDELAGYLSACITENDRLMDRSQKVGSNVENMMLCMRRTPKLIGLVKQWQPSTILVGFKLLDGVGRQALLQTAYNVMVKNSCDLMFANDLTEIHGERHAGYLLLPDRTTRRFEGKAEIARGIAQNVLNLIKKKE
ncbi:MAG: phosphopantothenate--cysteine ligase [Oscillospiraceae bacterium]|jgi:phosphopantothenate-cysteine ligase|nr:phosphopantothenate--cysteine ligase [Oscillospiraceae bacterium]